MQLDLYLKKGDIVIYESTVYPGATEEVCVPILKKSGLIFNKNFTVDILLKELILAIKSIESQRLKK